ncbi:hypothetical protein FF38_05061 [Lucilia cuprina]|uniref:Uncharacterized protein n=1 Tax=Lucilia cuprina TaxID=7375 RepID=A0A0L0C8J3_LUCCU|nr:hypothetical protein FF38_05061 [Lucilia cuprina]
MILTTTSQGFRSVVVITCASHAQVRRPYSLNITWQSKTTLNEAVIQGTSHLRSLTPLSTIKASILWKSIALYIDLQEGRREGVGHERSNYLAMEQKTNPPVKTTQLLNVVPVRVELEVLMEDDPLILSDTLTQSSPIQMEGIKNLLIGAPCGIPAVTVITSERASLTLTLKKRSVPIGKDDDEDDLDGVDDDDLN